MIELSKLDKMKVTSVKFKEIDPNYLNVKIQSWNDSFNLGLSLVYEEGKDESGAMKLVILDDQKFTTKYKAKANDTAAFTKWLTDELTSATSYSKVRREVLELIEETHLIDSITLKANN